MRCSMVLLLAHWFLLLKKISDSFGMLGCKCLSRTEFLCVRADGFRYNNLF